jgi:hypothetical protein
MMAMKVVATDKTPKRNPLTGHFAKGNKSGGRKPKRLEKRYARAFASTVKLSEWRKIIRRAVEDAIFGAGPDASNARKWLSDNLVGTPIQRQQLLPVSGKPNVLFILPPNADDEA